MDFINIDYILFGVVILLGIFDAVMSIIHFKPSQNIKPIENISTDTLNVDIQSVKNAEMVEKNVNNINDDSLEASNKEKS